MPLDNFDINLFLREYWQKKPLLIKAGWAVWNNPLEPDELAGLACEEGIESRIISQRRGDWTVEHHGEPDYDAILSLPAGVPAGTILDRLYVNGVAVDLG